MMRLRIAGIVGAATLLLAAAPASAESLGEAGGFIYMKRESVLPKGPAPTSQDATAKCPAGAVHTGGGGAVTGRPGGTFIASSGTAADKQWYVEGWQTGVNPKRETVTAWVICTEKTGKVTDESNLENAGPAPSGDHATASCLQGHAVGGGVRTIGAASTWWLNSSYPIDEGDAGGRPDDGWVAWVQHPAGDTHDFIVDVICMDGKEPIYREKAKTTSKKKVTTKAFCPKGTSVVGGGGYASKATDESHLITTQPIDSRKDADSVPDDGWKSRSVNHMGEQTFSAQAICK